MPGIGPLCCAIACPEVGDILLNVPISQDAGSHLWSPREAAPVLSAAGGSGKGGISVMVH